MHRRARATTNAGVVYDPARALLFANLAHLVLAHTLQAIRSKP
jgi:hypothetical protein